MANPIDNGPRIPGTGVAAGTHSRQADSTRDAPPGEAAASHGRGTDNRVESERLRQVQEKIDATPEVDVERVEAIKQAIAEGRYPIDAKQIAENFSKLEGLLNG